MNKDNKKNNISKQINKEVLITIGLYLFYFVWWYYFAYEYSSDNVEEYKYILGLPEWLIAKTIDEYIDCAVSLAENHRERLKLRQHIIENNRLNTRFIGDPSPLGRVLLERVNELKL